MCQIVHQTVTDVSICYTVLSPNFPKSRINSICCVLLCLQPLNLLSGVDLWIICPSFRSLRTTCDHTATLASNFTPISLLLTYPSPFFFFSSYSSRVVWLLASYQSYVHKSSVLVASLLFYVFLMFISHLYQPNAPQSSTQCFGFCFFAFFF